MNYPQEAILIDVPNAPAIPGLRFRRIMGEPDYPQMVELTNRANKVDDNDEVETLAGLSSWYATLKNSDPLKDTFVAEVDGVMVGHGRTTWVEIDTENELIYRAFFHVDPDWRNKGIGHAIFPVMLARCDEIAAGHDPAVRKAYQTFCSKGEVATKKLLDEFGFQPERFFYTMKADLSKPLMDAPMPEGLELRPATPEHYEKIYWALNEAFLDHWGHAHADEEDFKKWVQRIEAQESNDPSLWAVAWEGDEVAGMVLNRIFPEENVELDRKWGWTDPICVRRPWRKRGLASALIVHSQKMLRDEQGMEYAALGVDTENPSGALGLYERCGYEPYNEFVAYRKEMTAA